MKLHLGCGPNIKEGYVNVDAFVDDPRVVKADITNLPYADNSVDEILSEHVFEHVGFAEEERLFRECYRVLRPGGLLVVETPDMEWLCRAFMNATDDFKSFYKVGAVDHYFGNGRTTEQQQGMITTHFFGNQNGPGNSIATGTRRASFKPSLVFSGSAPAKCNHYSTAAGAIRATLTK